MYQLLQGGTAMAALVAGLFFLRFWRDTRDRFFLFFAVSFCIDGLLRVALGLTAISEEAEPFFYLVRLFSFLLILAAIVDKNRARGTRNVGRGKSRQRLPAGGDRAGR
ncbi:MAG TPA: DUF5985 family protein [Blastocatellia bacterium]|nr:DUF5985 family protein [Blastocatellia bacterium]